MKILYTHVTAQVYKRDGTDGLVYGKVKKYVYSIHSSGKAMYLSGFEYQGRAFTVCLWQIQSATFKVLILVSTHHSGAVAQQDAELHS